VLYRLKMASAPGGGELAALVGVAGLEDHRAALRAARDVELALMSKCGVGGDEGPAGVAQERAARLVGDDLVAVPRVEQLVGGGEELLGPGVALVLRQEAAAPEVLAGERVPGGDDVPGGAPPERWSRLANWRATSYGSLNVELMVPARPRWSVTAASAART
jgi:hypothetical protein